MAILERLLSQALKLSVRVSLNVSSGNGIPISSNKMQKKQIISVSLSPFCYSHYQELA